MPSSWRPSESDRAVGLGFFLTDTPGIPAQLKRIAEDFRVTEISAHPVPDESGLFTVLRVVSRDWEQHELSRRLARVLRLPPHAIQWAGTKDRRAVAERLASYRGPPPSGPIEIPGVEVVEAYRSRDGLSLGHHFGNSFEIRLSMAHSEAAGSAPMVRSTAGELRALGGFANLFGPQRFGEVRPVTHAVGEALVRGSVAAAVDRYLTAVPPDGDTVGVEARRAYAEHRDPARALREFPPQFTFERQMLEHLA
ncbi:MAG TPA: tRNA pseudouridine(13) synthase TruD, partial [Thermoplasmata archaeon]|nr:tRNA pseudouridine(13) synthase TruD [Thermoplasmata archaeon]